MGRFTKKSWKVFALVVAIVMIPTAAFAVGKTFSSTTVTPGVTGSNSSAAAGATGVSGKTTGTGNTARYGVLGVANGTAGVGVQGGGTQYGVFSNGPLGVAAGKSLSCTGCVGPAALSAAAKAIQPLASGESESGMYGVGGGDSAGGYLLDGLTFVRPLAAGIANVNIIDTGAGADANCPGPGSALAGYLCLYPAFYVSVVNFVGYSASLGAVGSSGAILSWSISGATPNTGGSYTVRAP